MIDITLKRRKNGLEYWTSTEKWQKVDLKSDILFV